MAPKKKGDRFIFQSHCRIPFYFQVKAQTERCRDLGESWFRIPTINQQVKLFVNFIYVHCQPYKTFCQPYNC
jgi:hypothetical protein